MFKTEFDRYLHYIEEFLSALPWKDNILDQSMSYSVSGGGKRIRPVLALAAADAAGGEIERIVPAAAALELIHTYSLIHDDLPVMDDDDYRRGRFSNHKVFGEANALLAGDALLTYAFEWLADPLDVQPERQLRVIREVAAAAGREGMVLGQVLDLQGESNKLSLDEVNAIHRHKTGAILVVSARLGAILAGGSEEEILALTGYAQALGLAFQIKDDILDLEGDSAQLGKPAGSDLKHEKSTYPSILGLAGAKEHLKEQTHKAKEELSIFGARGSFLRDFADYIQERQH